MSAGIAKDPNGHELRLAQEDMFLDELCFPKAAAAHDVLEPSSGSLPVSRTQAMPLPV